MIRGLPVDRAAQKAMRRATATPVIWECARGMHEPVFVGERWACRTCGVPFTRDVTPRTVRRVVDGGDAAPHPTGWCIDRLGAWLDGPAHAAPSTLFADMLVPSRFFEDRAGNRAASSTAFQTYADRFRGVTSAVCTVMPSPSGITGCGVCGGDVRYCGGNHG